MGEFLGSFRQRLWGCLADETSGKEEEVLRYISGITPEGRIRLISVQEIVYCSICSKRSLVKTEHGSFLSRFTLNELERRLAPFGFFRSHRGYVVNLKWIDEVVSLAKGTYDLVLADAERTRIPLSRRQAKKLRAILCLERFRL
ncbi:LytTR family DNA-binding domain-containing protein [Desulfothermobacter acidiphilus]|uniref:LytTR family DNA-binding domain-containing protein n=1 Tax=Desulfothermobacter acidiphilus TaxID=1938353 RepID=UPI003F8B32A0